MPLAMLPLIFQLLQSLPSLIQMAETAFSGKPGSGEAKKSLVMQSLQTALHVHDTVSGKPLDPAHSQAILSAASGLVDNTVTILNTVKGT